jgi:Na+-transporting NADH:ubiquinone oxidoreductase subunit A
MTLHSIKKGFDLRLAGRPEAKLVEAPEPAQVCLETADFPGVKPKPLVKEGDRVMTGQPMFLDKNDHDVVFCSPITGTVQRLDFGERRFLLRIVVANAGAGKDEFQALPKPDTSNREALRKSIKNAGLWPLLRQRPFGKLPKPGKEPVAIFVNGMATEPLAGDPAFALQGRKTDLQAGVDLLGKLTDGKVCLCLRAAGDHQSDLRDLAGVEVHDFQGPHPAGLVGTHIGCIRPLKQNEVAWYLTVQDAALLGEWARTGRYPGKRVVALAGSSAPARHYVRVRQNASIAALCGNKKPEGDVRVISGTVLSGTAVGADGFLRFYDQTVTCIPEGKDQRDLFGWAMPQFKKLSISRSVFSWLRPKQDHVVDARLNGGVRPIVNVGSWDNAVALDIHPSFLLRAIQANDVEEAMKLGLLEVTEEDVALCTFADPSKLDVGKVIRQGLDMVEKEG